ncbi:hypothetical protein [Mesorhizobium sp. M0571]
MFGNAAALGIEMRQAIELAIDEQNANGGIAGLAVMARASPIASP